MPDKPDYHKRSHPIKMLDGRETVRAAAKTNRRIRYAELQCKSNFSFLRGASHPEELVQRAVELGYDALAITDRNTLAGVVRMHCAAKASHLKLIVGAEVTPVDGLPLLLYAPDRASYGKLSRMITRGRLRCKKGACAITVADVGELSEGLIAVVVGDTTRDKIHRLQTGATQEGFRIANEECRMRQNQEVSTSEHLDVSKFGRLDVSSTLPSYRDIFADRLYLGVSVSGGEDDAQHLRAMDDLSRQTDIPLLATNDVHYHQPQRRFLHDVVTCIRKRCTIHEAGRRLFANAERHLKSIDEMHHLFRDYPQAIARTVEVANRCTFSLDELRYEYPETLCPSDTTPTDYLAKLTEAGAQERYPNGVPAKVRKLIARELTLIEQLAYEPYFLTVWDIVTFARSRDILCQGRGSAANSVVCYCLGITAVDPDRVDTLFERFISAERNEPPDIDVDFEHERREEVFQYIYNKYGREHAGIVAEVISYRPRSAVRDVGKALGLSLDRVDALAKKHEWWDRTIMSDDVLREAGVDPSDRTVRMLIKLVPQVIGFPRHLSQHVGGFVITRGPLCEMVPIGNGAMADRTFIEWDKDDIDALGILKVDCLALGMLTAIKKSLSLLRPIARSESERRSDETTQGQRCNGTKGRGNGRTNRKKASATHGRMHRLQTGATQEESKIASDECKMRRDRDDSTSECSDASTFGHFDVSMFGRLNVSTFPASIHDIPPEDPLVYDMICKSDTIGVFQIESRAQMSMLPRLKPRCYYDLVIEVAIVRPGPIQGGMVHPYLRRRSGEERFTYPNDAIRKVLERTLGVPLFQEQAMQLAIVAAGFTPGEADQLRRAMAAWRKNGSLDRFRDKLINGMRANGLSQEFAERCFKQICGFGEYGFPESHAASFALLVYVSCWLKRYHPAAFCAALINSQPMGFYQPAQLVRDAMEHGVCVLPVDVNMSGYDCLLEETSKSPNVETSKNRNAQKSKRRALSPGLCKGGVYESERISRSKFARSAGERKSDPSTWGADGPGVRLGMRLVKGVSRVQVQGIERAQRDASFRSVAELARRSGASRATLARLAAANAFRSMGLNRRRAVWDVLALRDEPELLRDQEPQETPPPLPEMKLADVVLADYDTTGLSLTAHPMSLVRDDLRKLGVKPNRVLPHSRAGQRVMVSGIVLVRQRPSTAGGIVFCTLEDETGVANLIIRPTIYERYRRCARGAAALVATGRIERQGDVVHVQVSSLEDVADRLGKLPRSSRDFH